MGPLILTLRPEEVIRWPGHYSCAIRLHGDMCLCLTFTGWLRNDSGAMGVCGGIPAEFGIRQ